MNILLQGIEKIARIGEIQQRIAAIEKQFGIGGDFQAKLEREIARQELSAQKVEPMPIEKFLEKISPVIEAENKIAESLKAAEIPEVAQVFEPPKAPAETYQRDNDFQVEAPTRDSNRHVKNTSATSAEDKILAAARKFGVDSNLVKAIATAESNIDQNAVSHVGAIGVMQLMPETAANLGVDPYDENQNIEGGAHYLRQMLDKFNGNLEKAIAAYNAGPGAVQKFGGVPPYAETQNYVGRVMDIYAN